MNAAVEWMIAAHEALNQLDEAPADLPLTDDFYAEDRRKLAIYRRADRQEWIEITALSWGLGSGQPLWDVNNVIAVRGEGLAALDYWMDWADGMGVEAIASVQVDVGRRRLRRVAFFDPDDRDAAIALLDEWHRERAAD